MLDITIEFYQINRNLISFLERTISFSLDRARTFQKTFVRARTFLKTFDGARTFHKTFDRGRTFTRTFDRDFVRGQYNNLKFCRLLLLLWRGKMIMNFLLYSWKN